MILLDTHVWVWWVHADPQLRNSHRDRIAAESIGNVFVSAISCWEIAKLVEHKRLKLSGTLQAWFAQALAPSAVSLPPLTPEIAAESVQLPATFHRDPSDQIIVASARVSDCELLTVDQKILAYPHVRCVP